MQTQPFRYNAFKDMCHEIKHRSVQYQKAMHYSACEAAIAITTTDLVSKSIAVETMIGDTNVRLGGMAKGSGMIHPNMATMLGVRVTCYH